MTIEKKLLGTNPVDDTGPYWWTAFGAVNGQDVHGIATDEDYNVYIGGSGYNNVTSGGDDFFLVKYDTDGILQWQKWLGQSSAEEGYGVAIDSNGYVYIAGSTYTSSKMVLAKYNSSGTLQWQRSLDSQNDGEESYAGGLTVDSSDNIYMVDSRTQSSGRYEYIQIVKYNTSGNIQYQRTFGNTTNASSDRLNSGRVGSDSSDNLYMSCQGLVDNKLVVVKYNSSGTLQWQKSYAVSEADARGIAVTPSGDIYITGSYYTSGKKSLIMKINTSGVMQWSKGLKEGTYGQVMDSISVDSDGNAYIAGGNGVYFYKYNSSGSLQWSRSFTGSNNNYVVRGNHISSNGDLHIGFRTGAVPSVGSSDNALVVKIPNDGTLTGTYGAFTYSAISSTAHTPSITTATTSYADASSSYTEAAGGMNNTTANYATTTVDIE